MKRSIATPVADLCITLWAAVPTFFMIETLLPGFISQLLDLTWLLLIAMISLAVVVIADIPIELSAGRRWYLMCCILLNLLLVGYHISLQVSNFLLALALSAVVILTILSAAYVYYDRRSQH